jgi:hypothetical protein
MIKRSIREVLFFILIFCLFFLLSKNSEFLISKGMNQNFSFMLSALLYTFLILAIYYFISLDSKEKFWEVSEYAKCRGGPYFWQGDSDNAVMCRALAETPEGRRGIASYNCPTGYNGIPSSPFYYSSLSDDEWKNERCQGEKMVPPVDPGNDLCSMEKLN